MVPSELTPFNELFKRMGVEARFSTEQYVNFLADMADCNKGRSLMATELNQALLVLQVCGFTIFTKACKSSYTVLSMPRSNIKIVPDVMGRYHVSCCGLKQSNEYIEICVRKVSFTARLTDVFTVSLTDAHAMISEMLIAGSSRHDPLK